MEREGSEERDMFGGGEEPRCKRRLDSSLWVVVCDGGMILTDEPIHSYLVRTHTGPPV